MLSLIFVIFLKTVDYHYWEGE